MGPIPGLGRSPGSGHGNPLQNSCLENPMDKGAWWTIVHRITKGQTDTTEVTQHSVFQKHFIKYKVHNTLAITLKNQEIIFRPFYYFRNATVLIAFFWKETPRPGKKYKKKKKKKTINA